PAMPARPGHLATAGAERAWRAVSMNRRARSGSTGRQVVPSTLRLVPTITPSATARVSASRSAVTPVFSSTGVCGAACLGAADEDHVEAEEDRAAGALGDGASAERGTELRRDVAEQGDVRRADRLAVAGQVTERGRDE